MATTPPARHLTEQQQLAVLRREVSVVLSSGAGCGKTHVLTERYLSHLELDRAEVGEIVAITFTDRAARQMRDRIRGAVHARLLAASHDTEADRWARHLRDLEAAQISTIHAFCGALLRQHAVEAGLDPHFDVLEDVLSANLEAEALSACLQDLLTARSETGDDLRQLVLLYGWRAASEAIRHLLQLREEQRWEGWLARSPEDAAAAWEAFVRTSLLPNYLAYLLAARPRIARCLALLRRTPPLPGSKMAANAARLLDLAGSLAQSPDGSAVVAELIELARVSGERAKAWPSEEIYEEAKAALEGFRTELREQRLETLYEVPENVQEAVAVARRCLRVAAAAAEAYRALKRQKSVLDFQDLLTQARDLLRESADVRSRLQNRYRFLLIDELQDTDPVQMELVELLCGTELHRGKLFAVGDHKQAIYRFRGADVQLFQNLRRCVPEPGRLELTRNFRSQPEILRFVNALLGRRMTDYEPLEPDVPQVNPGPCVEFLWSPRAEKEGVTEARKREADWIARRIVALVSGESLVVERTAAGRRLRPVRPGDVVLLFRAMSNVHLYEAALRQHGLHYYLVGGRAFFAQQEIYDLLNLLRALENPQDAVSLAGTLRSPFCCLSDETLFLLSRHPDGLWAGLHDAACLARLPAEQRPTAERARDHLDRWHALKDRLPIARLLGEAFADSGYDAATQFEFLGDRKLANLWKLVDLARTFDRSGLFGLAEFIQRLGDLVRTQPREEQAATQPENADVVRLMSIHQAKGLEFPVVFVPDLAAAAGGAWQPAAHWDPRLGCIVRPPADEEEPPFPDYAWRLWRAAEAVAEWHEDLRTLYVACTRAQDYLVLSAALPRPFQPATSWMLALAERFDLASGRCLADDVPAELQPRVRVICSADQLASTAPQPKERRDRLVLTARNGEGTQEAVLPMQPGLEGQRLFAWEELEAYRLRWEAAGRPRDLSLRPAEVAPQFDAEDSSDAASWLRPRELATARPGPEQAWRTVLLAVLADWDFRDPQGWQELLAREADARAAGKAVELHRACEKALARFAESPLYPQLRDAAGCLREWEFVLRWPPGRSGTWDGQARALHGFVDCLWQDRAGDWHLIAWEFAEVPADKEAFCQLRLPGLSVWAHAVKTGLGRWPASITRYFWEDGQVWTRGGEVLRSGQAAVTAALNDLVRRHLPPESLL